MNYLPFLIFFTSFMFGCNNEKKIFKQDIEIYSEDEVLEGGFENVSIFRDDSGYNLIFKINKEDHDRLRLITTKLKGSQVLLKSENKGWSVRIQFPIEDGMILVNESVTGTIFYDADEADQALKPGGDPMR